MPQRIEVRGNPEDAVARREIIRHVAGTRRGDHAPRLGSILQQPVMARLQPRQRGAAGRHVERHLPSLFIDERQLPPPLAGGQQQGVLAGADDDGFRPRQQRVRLRQVIV